MKGKSKNRLNPTKIVKTTHEYLSGICGSKKTEVLIDYCIEEVKNGKHFLYAVPFTELCDEIARRFENKGLRPVVIHSKNGKEDDPISVSERIIKAMDDLFPDRQEGVVIIITHQALRNLPYFPNNAPKSIWTVIHDEAVDPTAYIELRLKEHQHYIDGVFKIPKNKMHLEFVPVICKGDFNFSKQRSIIKNRNEDQVWDTLKDFYQHAENARDGKCDLFVHLNEYKSFKEGDGHKFVATVVYKPTLFSGFEKVIFARSLV